MVNRYGPNVYTRIGLRPFINCSGNGTKLGGSHYSPTVLESVIEANGGYVYMDELLEKSGEHIADLLGTEAAYVTSGAFAALALSAAACMTGKNKTLIDQLPDTTGMRNEIVIQKPQRFNYDRAFSVVGAKILEAGKDEVCTAKELDMTISNQTAAISYRARNLDSDNPSVLSLKTVMEVSRNHSVPVIVDAVKEIYPADYFKNMAQSADLVCFSGKYFGGPTSAGFVCGNKELIQMVSMNGHMGFYKSAKSFGRGFKVGRQEVVGILTALETWLTMNHEERLLGIDARLETLGKNLETNPYIKSTNLENGKTYAGSNLRVILNTVALGKSAKDVTDELNAGEPRILMGSSGNDTLIIMVRNLRDGEEKVVVQRLFEVLDAKGPVKSKMGN